MDITQIIVRKPYEALIFDCDGTLANTLPVHFQTWSAALQAVGANISKNWYYQYCGTSALEMLKLLKEEFAYQFDCASVVAERQARYQALIHTVQEIQAVADIARTHAGKVPMAVASGGERSVLEATLQAIKLYNYFDTIVSIDDVKRGKPEPDIFLLAAQRLGVAPENCVVYEDSEGGLEAARRAGMRSIDVRILN
jgi:HAD superfamily hydrolase (TIGR01509 family)